MKTRQSKSALFSAVWFSIFLSLFEPAAQGCCCLSVATDAAWGAYFCDVYVWSEADHIEAFEVMPSCEFCTTLLCARAWMHMLFFIQLTSNLVLSVSGCAMGGSHFLCFIWRSLIAHPVLISSPLHTPILMVESMLGGPAHLLCVFSFRITFFISWLLISLRAQNKE